MRRPRARSRRSCGRLLAAILVICASAPAAARSRTIELTEPSLSAAPVGANEHGKAARGTKRRVRRVIVRRYPAARWAGLSWDLQVELGYAFYGIKPRNPRTEAEIESLGRRFFGRVRAGLLWVREPWYLAFGATIEGPAVPQLAGGIQVELTHLYWGLWGQFGVSMGDQAQMFFHAAAGWSLFGFEWQRQIRGDSDLHNWGVKNAFLIKLRGPIGILFFGKVLH